MNSPATKFTVSPEEWMNLSKVALWHDYGDPGLLHNIIDEYADELSERVAVVRPTRDPNAKWCEHHDCALIEYKSGWWDCPLASLEDLSDHFQRLYETVYAPAPAGEDGVYHRAREIVDAIRGVAVSDSQETPTKGREK